MHDYKDDSCELTAAVLLILLRSGCTLTVYYSNQPVHLLCCFPTTCLCVACSPSVALRLEWVPGVGGHLRWYIDDELVLGIDANTVEKYGTQVNCHECIVVPRKKNWHPVDPVFSRVTCGGEVQRSLGGLHWPCVIRPSSSVRKLEVYFS